MLKAIGFIIKLFLFSALILIIGNWLSWDGRTLNHHLQSSIRQAERSDVLSNIKNWTHQVTNDAREGFEKRTAHRSHSSTEKRAMTSNRINNKVSAHAARDEEAEVSSDVTQSTAAAPISANAHATHAELQASSGERIPSSERQKLRALIRELNSSQDKR